MSWQPLAPGSGLCSLNAQIFMSQQRFFGPVISHTIFSSLFESGNTSTYLDSCLPASNVTFCCYLSGSHLSAFSISLSSTWGVLPQWVALLVFGVTLELRGGLQMRNVTRACTVFLVCSKTKGSFLWDTHDVEQNMEIKGGFVMPRLSCLWFQLGCR